MTRIAIVGANGQVGAEVSLGLHRQLGESLVPICRNRLGSAFLRYSGVRCRHGRVAKDSEAAGLLGDCDTIANLALGAGTPADAHRANEAIIRNTIVHSPPSARIILFSTVTVYDGGVGRSKTAYAQEKLASERLALSLGDKFGKAVHVLRLGHVLGELQGISRLLRDAIAEGPLYVPHPDRDSNTTHVARICEAVADCARGAMPTGVFDLYNHPHWTWEQVLEVEAEAIQQKAVLDKPSSLPIVASARGVMLRSMMGRVTGNAKTKERLSTVLARLSPQLNSRATAKYRVHRARADIAALRREPSPVTDAMLWSPVGSKSLPASMPTRDLLRQGTYAAPAWDANAAWPADLPSHARVRV